MMISDSGKHTQSVRSGRWLVSLTAVIQATTFLIALLLTLSSPPPPTQAFNPTPPFQTTGDTGDAPVASMTAYQSPITVSAQFPTIYVPGTTSGPYHHNPKNGPYLGHDVSSEENAHLTPDEDIITNIDPANDRANLDRDDDSIDIIDSLTACRKNSFEVSINVPGGYIGSIYLNIWLDFQRDGDWEDEGLCDIEPVSEWAVQNYQPTNLQPGIQSIPITITTYHPEGMDFAPIWMRISLSDEPAPIAAGNGPANGYVYGETEDYLLKYYVKCPDDGDDIGCSPQAGWQG